MQRAGADVNRESIVNELRNTKLDGLMGPVEFDAKGELKQPSLFLYKVEGNNFVLEWPRS